MNLAPSIGTPCGAGFASSLPVFTPPACPKPNRYHPAAHAIADALLVDPAVLRLRTRTLELDIQARYRVARCTAQMAIGIARRADRVVNWIPVEHSP